MAGLKKPQQCGCGSTLMKRQYHPERWMCTTCNAVIASRGIKPVTGVCRSCGAKETDVPFDNHGNICKKCKSEYNYNYMDKNRDNINEYKREYYVQNREIIRARSNAYWQSDVEKYMYYIEKNTRRSAARRVDGKERNLKYQLNKEILIELYYKQEGKCALSGLPLMHAWGQPTSISIDRIDSSLGYTIDNVQLVCQALNLAKKEWSNTEFIDFLKVLAGSINQSYD